MDEQQSKAEPRKPTDEESYLKQRDREFSEMREFQRNLPGTGTDREKLLRFLEEQKSTLDPNLKKQHELGAVASFSLGFKQISSFPIEDYTRAEAYYTNLLQAYGDSERDREYYSIRYERGLARKLIGDFDGALQDIEESCQSEHFSEDALEIGKFFVLKDRIQAGEILERLLAKYPDCSCLYRYKLGYQNPELVNVLRRLKDKKSGCPPIIYGVCQKMLVVNSKIRPLR